MTLSATSQLTSVREINDFQDLAALAQTWEALLAETPGGTFFQSLPWLQTYWSHFGADQRLRVLVVSNGEEVIGILPLIIRTTRRRIATVKVLTYPLDEWGSFYGPIGSQAAATLTAALNHIRRTRRDWDVMELPWVDSEGDDGGETAQALENAGFQATRETWQTSALIDLTVHGTWENYWASRQSHWRNNVRRSEKKLAARGKVTYVRYRSEPGQTLDAICGELFDACEAIARASWQASSSTGNTLVHKEVREFFRDCHVAANQAGSLDINLLLLDGKPVAFNYAYHHQGSVFGLRTGFDATAASDGAGSVLQARMIEDSFNRGDRTYNLGPGYLECKRYWLTETRPSFRYTHFPAAAPVAQLVRAKRSLQRMWYGQTQRVEPKK